MSESPRLNFPYIVSSHILDALVQPSVEAVLLTTPPAGPAAGMLYVIGSSPGGVWSGKGNCLTQYLGETWAFYVPFEGLTVWNKGTKTHWYYTGTQWSESKTDQHINRTDNPHVVTAAQVGAETPAGALSKVDTHANKATGAHSAAAVSVTAAGNISATNVQAALVELDTEKSPTTHIHSVVTTAANGFMASSDRQKLDGIAAGAEVNQNAFGTIVAGGVAAAADSKSDTYTITAGSGITITGDAANDACTIAVTANGHTHSEATTSAAGFMPAAMVTKLNGIATGAQVNQNAFSNVLVGTTTVAADSAADTLELAAGANIALTPDATNDRVTIAVSGTVPAATTAGACTGNAATATTLATARTIGISGDATGTATSFNGSANITIPLVLAASGVTAGTYTSVTVDAKGRVTAAANPVTISASTTGNAATATKLATARTINGVAFDGTANITIASVATATTANNIPTADVGGNIWIA